MNVFSLRSHYAPAGDQPKAIEELSRGLQKSMRWQTLLGATGTGKTFTVANIIARIGKPTLVIAHNKTLAAQLAQEYSEFFPDAAVHYFVSYYDYYQPEAYLPITDTYIEKETQINEEIDRLRHASTQSLLSRRDVIIVASVSCIYGLGNPVEYEKVNMHLEKGAKCARNDFMRALIDIHFERTNTDLTPGTFRAVGNVIEVMPIHEKKLYRIEIAGDTIKTILRIDAITRKIEAEIERIFLFPAKHFIISKERNEHAITDIKVELEKQLAYFAKEEKILEAERLKRRTNYDLAMIREIGYCSGIENYSRFFDRRNEGEAPYTLLSYFPHLSDGAPDFLTVIDESHVTIPQLRGMFGGDRSRKEVLVEHGFRLPSAKDNRPLTLEEFEDRIGDVIYTSATPGEYEMKKSAQIVEQIIRPTGLVDPQVDVRPILSSREKSSPYRGQVGDFIQETEKEIKSGGRVLATTLTKKMAEDLSTYLKEKGIKAEYLHSDIKTIDRITILSDFRRGVFDCLVGVNLLREGLDLPEVSLIGIFDADKEGFLRSETSLIQIIGRAARNSNGRVILYADNMTGSMERALEETRRRRELQIAYNTKHGITPTTISKSIKDITRHLRGEHQETIDMLLVVDRELYKKNPKKVIREKEKQMNEAVKILDFETAALLRDEIRALQGEEMP
ncbi:MAG: excinuclease ABC subunit B [Parcubacteria group bacterium Gr01-1014_48]|nr:MAG: excinuclease ABC subunit B [Parcubacteria group bacterium Greene0416_14]TSC74591.1 MAG: excinuclease ABC subunit B [Parcubacteria group bacterium Gr01-1014_48]TSD01610.1 MAG: excinuclease ABC subunit B [Parcubacteria group bacterium Greene1014_15]